MFCRVHPAEDRHVVPARQVEAAVVVEQAGEAVAVKRRLVEGMPGDLLQQVGLIPRQGIRRRPLGGLQRLHVAGEELIHPHTARCRRRVSYGLSARQH